MSLYDKYYSTHNKNYMKELINDIIYKEYNFDIKENTTYNQFFETNFINTFNSINTEDIKDLNNHLLNTQIKYFKDFILKKNILTKKQDNISLINDKIIHSLYRNINLNSSSRYNYRIKSTIKDNDYFIEKVIIAIEDNDLFINPILILSIDMINIELHLRGIITLKHRDYGIYTPFYEQTLSLKNDISNIQFKDQFHQIQNYSDVYKIIECDDKKITINANKSEFKIGDYIHIYNFENIELDDKNNLKHNYKIEEILQQDNLILTINKKISLIEGLYIMNISLQNSIHFSYN